MYGFLLICASRAALRLSFRITGEEPWISASGGKRYSSPVETST